MKTFKDNKGREWTVMITVGAIKRIKSLAGVDLLGALDGSLIEKLWRDPVLLCDVIYAAIKPQADERSVSDEDFGEAMAGDAIEHATQALLGEIVSFSPNSRDRANLERILAATNTVMEKARDLAEERISGIDLDEVVAVAAQQARSGSSSTSAPASSGSTRPP